LQRVTQLGPQRRRVDLPQQASVHGSGIGGFLSRQRGKIRTGFQLLQNSGRFVRRIHHNYAHRDSGYGRT
jgi:hypothetical protein